MPKLMIARGLLRTAGIAMCASSASLAGSESFAQYRADEPEVVASPIADVSPASDTIEEFRAAYRAAGQPRIALFWNVAFDDSTETERSNFERTQSSHSQSSRIRSVQPADPLSESTSDEDQRGTETVERVTGSRLLNPAKQAVPLDPVTAVELETAFRRQMQLADVRLMNRDFNIRMTQADRDRGGMDPKLIEADALAGVSDWLLEILILPDDRAPLQIGFKVSVTDVKTGAELISRYTAARPPHQAVPSYYVATASGFELRQSPRRLSADDVGVSLAGEILDSMRPVLAR